MSEFIFVKPKDGLTILHPDKPHAVIPKEGKRVRKSPYWARMEKQGAVEILKESPSEVSKEPVEEEKGV